MVNEKQITESLDESIFKNEIKGIIEKRLEAIKCQGPSTGYVDGVQYHKDYQRVTNGEAKIGNLEQKQLDYQLQQKELHNPRDPDAPSWRDPRSNTEKEMEKCFDFPDDMIGMGLHGNKYATENYAEPDDEYGGGAYGWEGGYERDTGASWSELDGAYDTFERQMDNAPPLQDNVMLFTHDIPNPNLQEGDVFQLDTFLGVNFQKGMVGEYDDSFDDVDIPYMRDNPVEPVSPYYNDSNNKPYEVTVLGSEGTPLLMEEPYRDSGYHINSHIGVLNKGQNVRLVRVDHEKRTAIYQTVDG